MGTFNMLRMLIWTTFIGLILQKHTTEQKSLHNPLYYKNNNKANTRIPEKHWPTYYRRVPATNADDDEVDIDTESDMMIKTLMEELVAKSRLVDIDADPVMQNDNTPFKVNKIDQKLESQPEKLDKVKIKNSELELHGDNTNGEKAKKEEHFTYKTKEVEKKTMNDMKEEKNTKSALAKVANIQTDNKIENKKDMTKNSDLSQDLNLKPYSLVGENDGNNTKTMPDGTMSDTLESIDTTATIFDQLKNQKLSLGDNQNKIEKKNLKTENQTTMTSLKELIQIVNEEKSDKLQETEEDNLKGKNAMNSKELSDTQVNRPLFESTGNHNKEDIVVHGLKEEIANQTTMESLKELKPILHGEKSEELTQQENLNSINLMHIKELKDTQVPKPLLDSTKNHVENKMDDVANNDAYPKDSQVVKYINFTIATDNTNIRQAEKIIATKQNDAVLKIQLDDLQVKAPEIKKIVKINGEIAEIVPEKAKTDNVVHNTEVQLSKVPDENPKLANEDSIQQKEALELNTLAKQNSSNTTKSSNKNSFKNEEEIQVNTEKDISKYDTTDTGASMGETNVISTKTEQNLKTRLSAIADNISEESNMNEKNTHDFSKEETIKHTLEATNFFVKKNRLEEEATKILSKEVFVPTTEAPIEHVLEQPNYMINKNNLDEATTMPSILFSAYTTEEPLENELEPTNFIVKKNASTNPSKVSSKSEAVIDRTKTQELDPQNDGDKDFDVRKPMGETTLPHTQLSMEETTKRKSEDTAKDESIPTLSETHIGEHKILSSTKFDDSDDKMKIHKTVPEKLATEHIMQELKIKPLPKNSSYEEMIVNTNTKDTESSIVADDTKHKLNITSTEVFDENSFSISEYVSKFLEALKPAIGVYDKKRINTTKHDITQTVLSDIDTPQIIKSPLKTESLKLSNTAQTNSDEYIEYNKMESTEVVGNDAGEESFKILNSIVDSSTKNVTVEAMTVQTIADEALNDKYGENIEHTIKENTKLNFTKLEFFQEPKPKEKLEVNKSTETVIEATTNGDSFSYNSTNNSDTTVAEENNVQMLEDFKDVISMVLEEMPYEVDNFLEKPIKLLGEAVPEIIVTDNNNTETLLSLEEKPEDSFDSKIYQISSNTEEKDNKVQTKGVTSEELAITGNNNMKTSSSLEERLEASLVDIKNQLSINSMDKINTKNDEELIGPLKMALEEIPLAETITEKTNMLLSLQGKLEKSSVHNENKISNKTVEKKNRRNDEQEKHEKESSIQVAIFENSIHSGGMDSFEVGGTIESNDLSNKKTAVKDITPSISTTNLLPTFTMNKKNNILEKPIQSPPPIIRETINQNHAQKKKNPENLLIKTIKASVDNDDESTKQPNNNNYSKILPMMKRTKITKLNEDVTATITCITRFKTDSLTDADKKTRQTIKNNDFKNIENNAKLTAAAAFNDDTFVNNDDGDSFNQQQDDELSPELKLVTWQTYTDNKFKVHLTEELTGKKQQTVESKADNDDGTYNAAYDEVGDDDNDEDADDDDDADDDENEDITHVVEGSSELSKENIDKINDYQNENSYKNSERFNLVAAKQVDNNNHQSTTNKDKQKTNVSNIFDGQVIIQEQLNNVDSVTNRPHLSSSIKHYRIDDNAYGNRKNILDQMEQLDWQYPDTTQYNDEKNIFSEAHELPSTETKSATPTTTNWWNTLPYEEIRKFLNTIFHGTADDIYREIARRAKEAQMREAKKIKEDQRKVKESWKQSNEWPLL